MNAERLVPFDANAPTFLAVGEAYADMWSTEPLRIERFLAQAAPRPGFRGVAMQVGAELAGFAFGADLGPGCDWYDALAAALGPKSHVLDDTWWLLELAAFGPDEGLQARARALHDAVLVVQPHPRALVATPAGVPGLATFYEDLGWHMLMARVSLGPASPDWTVWQRECVA